MESWPAALSYFHTAKGFVSEAASGGMFEFLKVLQFRLFSENV